MPGMAHQIAPHSSESVRRSRTILQAMALACAGAIGMAETPERVVSINMCTDQLAMDLAGPGQLISVTRMIQRDGATDVTEQARQFHGNTGRAEEVYLLKPDLVLAGTFTAPATIQMLQSLGIRVEQFAPTTSLDEISQQVRRMGALLGRKAKAAEIVTDFETKRAALTRRDTRRPRAALIYVNSFAPGTNTLANDILTSAGFNNIAAEAGLNSVSRLPLEQLIMLAPEVIISGHDYPGAARAEDSLTHPALRAIQGSYFAGELTSPDWTCGTPRTLRALQDLAVLRDKVLNQ